MKSELKKNQVKKLTRKKYASLSGELTDIYVEIRFDDRCGNGHNTFSITGNLYEAGYKSDRRMISGGCIHEEIIHAFPELQRACAFHLCSTDGPMHYIANSLYHANDRDCHGLRKGEPDLRAARACAIWPEALLEDFTRKNLEDRLPALLIELREIVESFGMIY